MRITVISLILASLLCTFCGCTAVDSANATQTEQPPVFDATIAEDTRTQFDPNIQIEGDCGSEQK